MFKYITIDMLTNTKLIIYVLYFSFEWGQHLTFAVQHFIADVWRTDSQKYVILLKNLSFSVMKRKYKCPFCP